MMQKINSYIHFAVRANKVLWGLDSIKQSRIKPYVVIYDKSLGKNSKKQLDNYLDNKNIHIIEVEENYLNELLKRSNVKLIGIIDESLAKAIISLQ